MKSTSRKLLLPLLPIFAAVAAFYAAGSLLSAPVPRSIGVPPAELRESVNVRFGDVTGWYVPSRADAPCVLLMHGVRADRRSMIERALVLREAGYASLLFDFQAHGESPGEHITFGFLESNNARAGVALLRSSFGCTKVAAIGVSLGGAAALIGSEPLDVDALVLESVYPTIDEAVANRLRIRLGSFGASLSPLFVQQLRLRLGIDPRLLRPIDYIGRFHRPVLIMNGSADRHTSLEEARRLFAAANEPKEFWPVPDAAHVDLQRYAPARYRERLLAFLDRYL